MTTEELSGGDSDLFSPGQQDVTMFSYNPFATKSLQEALKCRHLVAI
jgi:hypothetical protein